MAQELTPEAARRLFDNLAKQVRFASSQALNRVANRVQTAIVDHARDAFTVRRTSFLTRSIYRKPNEDFATKDNLRAAVRTNPDRGDIYAQHEAGHAKTARDGGRLAVPVEARRNIFDVVPNAQKPKALGRLAFPLPLKSGNVGLFVRKTAIKATKGLRGKKKLLQTVVTGRDKGLVLAHVLVKKVPIFARLGFHVTAQRIAAREMASEFRKALLEALRTAR
jgi:hypothetical protein